MAKNSYDIDQDVYKAWLKDKMETIASMSTTEQIEERINELAKIEFFAAREWAILHQRWDELTGRKRIPTYLKQDRDRMITEPNIKVDWDNEPRKTPKEKKPKEDMVQKFFGMDLKEMARELKSRPKASGNKPSMMEELLALQTTSIPAALPKPKASADDIKAKADAMKEKIRLAKEAKEKK